MLHCGSASRLDRFAPSFILFVTVRSVAIYYARLLMLVAVLVCIVAVIGSLLPRSYDFESVVVIDAPPASVFQKVNTMKSWQEWSQWSPQQVEDLRVEYSGTPAGVGAAQAWTDQRGDGKLWVIESIPNQKVAYQLEFAGFPEMASSIELIPVGDESGEGKKTKVVWSSSGTLPGGPFYGFFSPFFANGMKHQYDASLGRLKGLVENRGPLTAEPQALLPNEREDAALPK